MRRLLMASVGVALVLLLLTSLIPFAQSNEQDANSVFDVFDIPFRPPDTADPIDGKIGRGWNHALQREVLFGKYPVLLRVQHDGQKVYFAIELLDAQGNLQADDLSFWVMFDNGDGELFGVGDDQIRVPVSNRFESSVDYHGSGGGRFALDKQQDAGGYGTQTTDNGGVRYVVELFRPLDSDDESDFTLVSCSQSRFTFGFTGTLAQSGNPVEEFDSQFLHLTAGQIVRPPTYDGFSLGWWPSWNPSIPVCEENTTQGFYPPVFDQTSGGGVFLHNGELFVQEVDLAIPGRGLSWSFERSYRSGLIYDGPLGHGWEFNYNRRLLEVRAENIAQIRRIFEDAEGGDLVRMDGTGCADLYVRGADGDYTTPTGFPFSITKDTYGGFIERDRSGGVIRYQPADSNGLARLLNMVDRNGNAMQFQYNNVGQLIGVIDTLGRQITYSYDSNGRLIEVRDFANRAISLTYDERGDLISIISPTVTGTPNGNDFPNGKTVRYTYSSGFEEEWLNHNLLTITAPNEDANGGPPRVRFEYDTNSSSLHADRVLSLALVGKEPVISEQIKIEVEYCAIRLSNVTKSVDDTFIPLGGELTYTISLSNPSTYDISGIVLFDPLPPQVSFSSFIQAPQGIAFNPESNALEGRFDLGALEDVQVIYTVDLNPEIPGGTTFANCVVIESPGFICETCTPVTTVCEPPQAVARCNHHSRIKCKVTLGEKVYFDGKLSRAPDGQIVSYFWDFGDRTTATGLEVEHVYRRQGRYKVCLTVIDEQGVTDTDCVRIEVVKPPPIVVD